MGAGTSAEQVADKPKEEQAEQSNDLGQEQQDGQGVEVDAAIDVKVRCLLCHHQKTNQVLYIGIACCCTV